jgi:hypothetical protein
MFDDSPLVQEIVTEARHRIILRILTARFGTVSPEIAVLLQPVQDEQKLDDLVGCAATCPDLEAFRARLSS